MVKEVESVFTPKDGKELFAKTWVPEGTPKAHLIYIHGFSDRCEIHHYLFPTLASSPFNIQAHSFDQRGWGKSVLRPSEQGDSGPTTQVLSDIHQFVLHTASSIGNAPLFIMGHSMGGQEVLHYTLTSSPTLLNDRPKISGVIIEAPYIGLDPKSEPNAFVVLGGKVAAKLMPKMQLKQQLDAQYNTHDPAVNEEWRDDPLCHDTGTLEGLRDMLQRGAELKTLSVASNRIPQGLKATLPVPTLWTHGTEDKICAFPPSKALFERLAGPPNDVVPTGVQGKTFRPYEGAYHKIHCEPDGVGEAFSKDVGKWIISVVDAEKSGTTNGMMDGDGVGESTAKL